MRLLWDCLHCGRQINQCQELGEGWIHNTAPTSCSADIQTGPEGTVPSSVGPAQADPHVHS